MLMIGVSTGQNITNLIPAILPNLKIKRFLILETATAKKSKWSTGLQEVLHRRNIVTSVLDLEGIDSHISKIQAKVLEEIKNERESIIWNLGGGQKPQQIAIWEIFKTRNEKMNIPDVVCYANQDDTGLLEIWHYHGNELVSASEKIVTNLSAEEIFHVFGVDVKATPQIIYKRNEPNIYKGLKIKDLLSFKEFREFLFRLPDAHHSAFTQVLNLESIRDLLDNQKIKIAEFIESKIYEKLLSNMSDSPATVQAFFENDDFKYNKIRNAIKYTKFQQFLIDLIKEQIPFETIHVQDTTLKAHLQNDKIELYQKYMQELTGHTIQKASIYFEQILIQRVITLLQSSNHHITQAYANLVTEKDGRVLAEYDILCVTEKGTIIALDAKTFEFENKDIDARLYNLEKGSGYYRSFSAVFPYNSQDITEKWFKQIKDLPFKLARKKLKFYVIDDSQDGSFWIKKEGDKAITKTKRPSPYDKDWIECKPLKSFLSEA